MEQLRQEAEWGDKMRPSDPAWIAESHRLGIQIQKLLLQRPPQMLLECMPRNRSTMRYEPHQGISDKTQSMKFLLNMHAGEIRETYGFWQVVQTSLPASDAWYVDQYPVREEALGINTFLKKANEESEHCRRASWGFTLPRFMAEFGEKHTFETIYELFLTLPIMVSKKKCGSKRAA